MKEKSLLQKSIDSDYIYNLPIDVSNITFIWTDKNEGNKYRKFTSNLTEDNDGTEERKWLLPTKQFLSDSDVAKFIYDTCDISINKSLVIEYQGGIKDILNIE